MRYGTGKENLSTEKAVQHDAGAVSGKAEYFQTWTCYNRTKLRETQQNQGFALI